MTGRRLLGVVGVFLLAQHISAAINKDSTGMAQQMISQSSRQEEQLSFHDIVSDLCVNRPPNEYFRLTTEGDCRDVVRCDRAGIAGTIRLASVKCPSGLAFDLERQTCDWKAKVDNCDHLSKPRLVKPNLNTTEPLCPNGELQCGDGECISQEMFCDQTPNCNDGSDESACSMEEDPNRAGICDPNQCLLPDCFCSADGTAAPGVEDGRLEVSNLPMMITISFNGAVNEENVSMYDKLFHDKRLNPNGCTTKASFFVSHEYSNYSAVHELHRKGHEIGVFSITNEMVGVRLNIERFANITDGSVLGVRAPFLRVGGNKQFKMMTDKWFVYDTSITAPRSRVPIWPYTLHARMPHRCHGNSGHCPSRSYPVWEMPINELDRRDDPDFDKNLAGCHLVSSCSDIYHKDQFRQLLQHNFERHYSTNKAPLSLAFDPSWLISHKGFMEVLDDWMDFVLATYNDVYFVTKLQLIQWMQKPTGTPSLRDFEEWKDKCAPHICYY